MMVTLRLPFASESYFPSLPSGSGFEPVWFIDDVTQIPICHMSNETSTIHCKWKWYFFHVELKGSWAITCDTYKCSDTYQRIPIFKKGYVCMEQKVRVGFTLVITRRSSFEPYWFMSNKSNHFPPAKLKIHFKSSLIPRKSARWRGLSLSAFLFFELLNFYRFCMQKMHYSMEFCLTCKDNIFLESFFGYFDEFEYFSGFSSKIKMRQKLRFWFIKRY